MNTKTALMVVSASIMLWLGFMHLLYTFRGPKLFPRDPGLIASMKGTSPVISSETTIWNAWLGFNASHSIAAMLFGVMFGYLAVAQPAVLYGSLFLQLVGFLTLAGFFILGWMYWFSVPFAGISTALTCYVASCLLAYAQTRVGVT